MLQRNPVTPNELPPLRTVIEPSEATDQTEINQQTEKYIRRRGLLMSIGKAGLTTSLLFGTVAATYLCDVRENMRIAEEAQPSIDILHEAPTLQTSNHANVYFDGFNTYDANFLTRKLGTPYQAVFGGENWSVQYNNAILDSKSIAEELIINFQKNNITSVDFTPYSMGNVPMADAALETIATTDIDVQNITFLSGPADFSTLSEKTQNELSIAKNLAWIPWIEYSTPFRYGMEVYFYRNDVQKNVSNALGGINSRFANGKVTSNAFLVSQINAMTDADISQKMREIGTYADTKHMPNINIIKGRDDVVDIDTSAEKICEAAVKANLNCTILEVDSQHGLYFLPKSAESYTQTFAELARIVKPYTAQEVARHALRLYDQDGENYARLLK